MKKSFIVILIALTLLAGLVSACKSAPPAVSPDPAPATSTPSPTPTSTPTLAPCDHDWIEASCDNSEICSKCGATGAPALEHKWNEANYQMSAFCLLCFKDEGDPLTPGFVEHGMKADKKPATAYPYVTIGFDQPEKTIGEVTLKEVSVTDSFKDNAALDGYEFLSANFVVTFSDSVAQSNGARWTYSNLDFYTFDPAAAIVYYSDLKDSEIPGFTVGSKPINYYGIDWDIHISFDANSAWSGNSLNLTLNYTFMVPVDYDGVIITFTNSALILDKDNLKTGDLLDDDSLFFRLRG